jgi:hypothetical protein
LTTGPVSLDEAAANMSNNSPVVPRLRN